MVVLGERRRARSMAVLEEKRARSMDVLGERGEIRFLRDRELFFYDSSFTYFCNTYFYNVNVAIACAAVQRLTCYVVG